MRLAVISSQKITEQSEKNYAHWYNTFYMWICKLNIWSINFIVRNISILYSMEHILYFYSRCQCSKVQLWFVQPWFIPCKNNHNRLSHSNRWTVFYSKTKFVKYIRSVIWIMDPFQCELFGGCQLKCDINAYFYSFWHDSTWFRLQLNLYDQFRWFSLNFQYNILDLYRFMMAEHSMVGIINYLPQYSSNGIHLINKDTGKRG